MTADILGLSFFTKRDDMAVVTLTVPAYATNSSHFNFTVMTSNTVEFIEVIASSTNGVSSTLRSNIWSTMSDPFYCKFNPHGRISRLFWLTNPFDNLEHYEGVRRLRCSYLLQHYKSCLTEWSPSHCGNHMACTHSTLAMGGLTY